MEQEGVIKYHLDFLESTCEPEPSKLALLNDARSVLIEKGMMGQNPARYEGYGFGNLSFREGDSTCFWVSGSQTGHLNILDSSSMARVIVCDAERNYLKAEGLAQPSSESMTHGVLYQLDARINAVIHVHCPRIWNNAASLGIQATPTHIAYGTPEMARAVATLSKSLLAGGFPIAFAMLGHEDGVVASGNTLAECLELLSSLQATSPKGL